jgi:hypothetical protein
MGFERFAMAIELEILATVGCDDFSFNGGGRNTRRPAFRCWPFDGVSR